MKKTTIFMSMILYVGATTLTCSGMNQYADKTIYSCAEKGDYEGIKELLLQLPTAHNIDAKRKEIVKAKNISIDCLMISDTSNPAKRSAAQSIYQDDHQIIIDSCVDLQEQLVKNKILKLYPECLEALLQTIEADMEYLEKFAQITEPESMPLLELPPLNQELKDALTQIQYNYINAYEENSCETALYKATQNRESTRVTTIMTLLKEGADPNRGCYTSDQNILHWESFFGHLYAVTSLIENYGANIYHGAKPCTLSAQSELEIPSNTAVKPCNLRPFEQACETPHLPIIEYFLDNGIDPYNPSNSYDPDYALHVLLSKMCTDHNFLPTTKSPVTLHTIQKLIEKYKKIPYPTICALLTLFSDLSLNNTNREIYQPLFTADIEAGSLTIKFFKTQPKQLFLSIFKTTDEIILSLAHKNNQKQNSQKTFFYNGSNEEEKHLCSAPIEKLATYREVTKKVKLTRDEACNALHKQIVACFQKNNWKQKSTSF